MVSERRFKITGTDYVAGGNNGVARGVDGGGDGPHDGRMESRVRELEKNVTDVRERLVRIETTLSHMATSQALEKLGGELKLAIEAQGNRIEAQATKIEAVRSDLIKWFVATALILATFAFTAARYTSH
ncbi:hypothetical protein SAMN02800694_0514 [Luteibacter sp. UNCMF331Sha3.1]|uniref:hypothetical protein n=1 Tax=Luteibacter sp. UNCMF331Sha3.1 TaxID=1502760 RepID=UPI0008C1E56F|nr:hypothetical protein [Luteibacter sp. UNCMF331Sha3.1]SEM28660.1 hypothetical protein SAMN02800694_0514 [Luteibacter sp. UNCMF331Sha3.1]